MALLVLDKIKSLWNMFQRTFVDLIFNKKKV